MAAEDRARWEAKYRAGEHTQEDPAPFLLEMLLYAPFPGRALDVACGRGRHAIALARRGYDVDAVDLSPTALASARERAGGLDIHWIEADLDRFVPQPGRYAVVVCVGFTRAELMPELARALQPGGLLVYAARPRAQRRFGPLPGDVSRWFASLETVVHEEDDERVRYAGRRRSGPRLPGRRRGRLDPGA